MSLTIKDSEAERLAAEIGALTGESKTAAVITALRERRELLLATRLKEEDATMAEDLLTLAAEIRSALSGADLSSDFLHDSETGLPAGH